MVFRVFVSLFVIWIDLGRHVFATLRFLHASYPACFRGNSILLPLGAVSWFR